MANVTYNGTGNVTADRTDTVTLNVDPQTFTQAFSTGDGVTLQFGNSSITITGANIDGTGLGRVFLQGGRFEFAGQTNQSMPATNQSVLSILTTDGVAKTYTSTDASSKIAVFGGQNRSELAGADGGDSIAIGGKGSFLVYGNSGADSIGQSTAFDSTAVVNVYGGQGGDSIDLGLQNTKASIFVSGGLGRDTINVVNSGTTTVFGGLDSSDLNDTITLNGVAVTGSSNTAAGTSVIFGNGGADTITIGNVGNGIDSTSTTTVYGGFDSDTINVTGTGATISVLGNEGGDNIIVANTGSTFITGGNQGTSQTGDGADTIVFRGSGKALIYGNLGDDSVTVELSGSDSTSTADVSVYGGQGGDTISVSGTSGGLHNIFVVGGESTDTINVTGNGGATTIYGGISNADATDSADTISYQGSGTANIFGNGGNDTINIGQLGAADSTNATVTVNGGVGNDSINVDVQTSSKQSLVLTGGEGSDTFAIARANFTEQGFTVGSGQTVTITDFTATSTGDKLVIGSPFGGGTAQLGQVTTTYTTAQLQQALDAASAVAQGISSQAAAVRVGSDTYVVLENNNNTTFTAGVDQAIKLTGVTDLNALIVNTTVSGNNFG